MSCLINGSMPSSRSRGLCSELESPTRISGRRARRAVVRRAEEHELAGPGPRREHVASWQAKCASLGAIALSRYSNLGRGRGTPDMVLRDAGPTNAQLAPFANKSVRLVSSRVGSSSPTVPTCLHDNLERHARTAGAFELIDEAMLAGARRARACEVAGLATRTVERWRKRPDGDFRRGNENHRARVTSLLQAPVDQRGSQALIR